LGLAQETFNDLQRNIENLDDFDFTDVNTFTSVNTIDKTLKLLSSKVSFLNPKNEKENEKFWNFIFRFKNPNVLKYILKKYKKFPFKVDMYSIQAFLDSNSGLKIKEENFNGGVYNTYERFKRYFRELYGDEVYAKVLI
jgi:hypothetical protein